MTKRLQNLGGMIRAARLERGLSLRATAGAAKVSPSLLSQVETGKIQPSVSTLYSIVRVLDLSVDELLGVADHKSPRALNDPTGSPVLPAGEGISLLMERGVRWERLASGNPRFTPLLVTYEPGSASSVDDTNLTHIGVEYAYIIEGEMSLQLEEETYTLRAGDSLCFDSRRPHLFSNHTEETARGIWFVVGQNKSNDAWDELSEVRTAVDVIDEMNRQSFATERHVV